MTLYTIGFTKSTAESFFERLRKAGVKRVIDVRLNNVSQLSGFAKKTDLEYFLRTICGIGYVHRPELAPTQEMLDEYKKKRGAWAEYERQFLELMGTRSVERTTPPDLLDEACLLCSEDTADHCHRRVVAEYLKDKWGDLQIVHL